jgi:hypothetical protein
MKVLIIPLGHNCGISFILKDYLGLYYEYTPLEWNTSYDFNKVVELIKNKFNNYNSYEIYPSILESTSDISYKNNYYNIIFNHDVEYNHETKKNYLYINKNIEKYNRRINRLYQKIELTDIIIFVRTGPNILFDNNKLSVNLDNNGLPSPTDYNVNENLNDLKNLYPTKITYAFYINNQETFDNTTNHIKEILKDNELI